MNEKDIIRKKISEPFVWDAEQHWRDPLFLDEQLTEDEIMLRDAAKKYTDDFLRPRVQEHFRREEGDTREIIREMGQNGLLGINMPARWAFFWGDRFKWGAGKGGKLDVQDVLV